MDKINIEESFDYSKLGGFSNHKFFRYCPETFKLFGILINTNEIKKVIELLIKRGIIYFYNDVLNYYYTNEFESITDEFEPKTHEYESKIFEFGGFKFNLFIYLNALSFCSYTNGALLSDYLSLKSKIEDFYGEAIKIVKQKDSKFDKYYWKDEEGVEIQLKVVKGIIHMNWMVPNKYEK